MARGATIGHRVSWLEPYSLLASCSLRMRQMAAEKCYHPLWHLHLPPWLPSAADHRTLISIASMTAFFGVPTGCSLQWRALASPCGLLNAVGAMGRSPCVPLLDLLQPAGTSLLLLHVACASITAANHRHRQRAAPALATDTLAAAPRHAVPPDITASGHRASLTYLGISEYML